MVAARSGSPRRLVLVLVLGLVDAVGPLSIDLYVPSFPELQRDLTLSDLAVQLTLAVMTAGLALGQAFVGAWSDRVGRRRPMLLALGLYVAGAITCLTAPSLGVLLAGRIAQGLGAAGGAVLVLAIVRDLSEGDRFVTLLTRVTLITTTAPLLAPVLGAVLLPIVRWRGLFALLALLGLVLLLASFAVLPETRRQVEQTTTHRLGTVLRDREFRWATLLGAATYAGVYAYVAASPLLLRTVLGLSAPQFAFAFLASTVSLALGVQAGGRATRRTSGRAVLIVGGLLELTAAAALVPAQHLGLAGVVPCLCLFMGASGACFPPAATIALRDQGAQAGTATSVYGFTTFAVAALISPIPGLLGITSAVPVALVLSGTAAVTVLGAWWRPRRYEGIRARPSRCPAQH